MSNLGRAWRGSFLKFNSPLKVSCALLTILLLLSAPAVFAAEGESGETTFTKDDKAFYLSEKEQIFIRPGLVITIVEASIDADGTVQARFTATDPAGMPLDRNGVFTPGAISTSFIIAVLPAGESQYVSYATSSNTSRPTSPFPGVTEVQASSDSGGTYEEVTMGEYIYTFGTVAPAGYDRSATHTVGVYARRDLREFDLDRPSTDDTFNFVPDGSEVTRIRDIVATETCNNCHTRLTLHGRRHSVELCILCHTPQTVNPDTGNTTDMAVMIHKIHMGADLPSVQAGTPYQIIRSRGVFDFSDVHYPTDVMRCDTCHVGTSQVDAYLTNPNRAACGSCHDDVNFDTGEGHASLPQVSDSQCSRCHAPEGELEFDLSIIGAHTVERFSKELRGVNFELMAISDTAPGRNPTVTFSVNDNEGNPVVAADMNRLRLILAGPTTDISYYSDFEDARSAEGSGGVYTYTMETPIPEDAQGTWIVGIEGRNLQTLQSGTLQERTDVRDLGENKVLYFPVTDAEAVPRRQVVAQEKCEACHAKLREHGGNRTHVDYCVLCHNPLLTDIEERPEGEPGENVNFKNMIHKIHTGSDLDPGAPFIVEGTDLRRSCTSRATAGSARSATSTERSRFRCRKACCRRSTPTTT